jgi:hypothetical protein
VRRERPAAAAVQQQPWRVAEQIAGCGVRLADQRQRRALATGREPVVGVGREHGVRTARGRQLRGALAQAFAHQRRRRRDAAAAVAAVGIDEIERERGADAADERRARNRARTEHRKKPVDAEPARLRVRDFQAREPALRAREPDARRARGQRIEQLDAQRIGGDARHMRDIDAFGQHARELRGDVALAVRERVHVADAPVRAQRRAFEPRVAEVEQPHAHAALLRTLTSPECTRRSSPEASRTRRPPSSARPSAVAGSTPSAACSATGCPASASSAA